jgi:hypothetical protein
MNGRTRLKKYQFVAKRDGEFCKGCCALQSERQLIVDHIDNNSKNNKDGNLQLLCRTCNYIKNPRGPLDLCEREVQTEGQSELEVSKLKQPAFRKYVFQQLREHHKIPEKDLINSACEVVDISPVTGKRYLDRMCSSEGILKRSISVKTIVVSFKDELKLI